VNRLPLPPAFPSLHPVAKWAHRLRPMVAMVVLSLGLFACRPDDELDDDDPLPARPAAVLIDGCSLDGQQSATLRGMATRSVLSEVILLCLSIDDQGSATPREGTSDAALKATIGELRQLGYTVGLGVTAVDSDDDEQPKEDLSAWFAQSAFRSRSVAALATYAAQADSLQIALPELLPSSRADLSAWVTALSLRLRPAKRLGIFVPPSLRDPSDQPGGDAYDLAALRPRVDRLRLLTVEAASGEAPGPTFDADWTQAVATFALGKLPANSLDVAVPLYGVDFQLQPGGSRTITDETTLSFAEATALLKKYGKSPEGEAGEARHFSYQDGSGNAHEVWYEDSDSIIDGLGELSTDVLPESVGLVFVGLGGEDGELFADLAEALAKDVE